MRGKLAPQPGEPLTNNYMMENQTHGEMPKKSRGEAYFPRGDMEIESGYPSESDASHRNRRNRQAADEEALSRSCALLKRVRVPQEARFRIFQSIGFQGNPNDALDLICLTLRSLEFVSRFLLRLS